MVWDGGGSRYGHPPTAPLCSPGCRAQQLAVRLQPRGVLFSKFTLVEQWDGPGECEPRVFGVELGQLVERENSATKVPLLIQKCVAEIEKRGLKVVGLYRLCGSAAVKKELRDAFERDSAAVTLSEQLYPDINVITGILKDYLRELPTPLITPTLYHVVLEAMAKRPPRTPPGERDAVTLLDCLPDVEKATLTRLLDHLSLVASFHDFNRMNPQNIAVCFGPVLLTQSQEPRRGGGTGGARSYAHSEDIASAVDFKRHIEVLHYLLQAWPGERRQPGRPRQPALHLELLDTAVVARHRPRGPESPPSNRYAGDWSVCSHQFGGYDEVPGRPPPEAPFGPRLNLKDFDALILDLERELAKQINVCL
uniref:Rho GTPase-activating protein SYDE1 n=1 Tax=Anas platyrhynchos TaxID=8839 RepID=A0A8B9TJJ3_ANAPL